MSIKRPEGTNDYFGEDMRALAYFYDCAKSTFQNCGYEYVETPIFEQTDLFVRGLGEASDVVNKEMYSAISGGNIAKMIAGETLPSKSRLTLRPEGTAGIARAIIQNNLVEQFGQPKKFFYIGPMFRAERPQKGRMRQFYQAGAECVGSSEPLLDAQMIAMAQDFIMNFCNFEASDFELHLNSIGCENCRSSYRELLVKFEEQNKEALCESCNSRIELNPLRAFDCKNETCKSIMEEAPRITDHLCEDCERHFKEVKSFLDYMNVSYIIDSSLVRGLDYYTRTVFEFTSSAGMGSQNALCGGGRYDHLIEELGGKHISALGFAAGFERLKLAAESKGTRFASNEHPLFFIVALSEEARKIAREIILNAHSNSNALVEMDYRDAEEGNSSNNANVRSAKSQFKLADKLKARVAIVIGEDEINASVVQVRDMDTHAETNVKLDRIIEYIANWQGK